MDEITDYHGECLPHRVESLQTKCGVIAETVLSTIRGVPNTERPSDMMVQAGLRLKAARLALGVELQLTMATVLTVGESTYNNWERGKRLPDIAAMVRLLTKSGISLDWIYGGELRSMPFDLATKVEERARELGAILSIPPASNVPTQDVDAIATTPPKPPATVRDR